MVAALVLAFREGLEAALILGIVMGVLRGIGRRDQQKTAWLGAGLAALLSLSAGIGLYALGISFEGRAEQVFEGLAILLAAGVLTWMIFWMDKQGRQIQDGQQRDVRQAALGGGTWAIFSLAFLAVLREGIEMALFWTASGLAGTMGGAQRHNPQRTTGAQPCLPWC